MWKSWALASTFIAFALPAQAEAPKVVTTIQPLHSLAASVMKGVGEPGLIVTGAQSEHSYALKPSDARALQGAQLVVMVDEHYEAFLARPLKGAKAQRLALADLPGAIALPPRAGGLWEAEHGSHHDHDHELDGHVWLDPANARLLVAAFAHKLAALDPANAATYLANATATTARLNELDGELRAKLAPVAAKPYVVFHDAYQYFEKRYGLAAAGSITVDPDRPPSAKRLAALRDRLKQAGAACVFREPQFPAPIVESLAQQAGARVGVLDPQGADIPTGPDLYFTLMTRLADSLTSCLR